MVDLEVSDCFAVPCWNTGLTFDASLVKACADWVPLLRKWGPLYERWGLMAAKVDFSFDFELYLDTEEPKEIFLTLFSLDNYEEMVSEAFFTSASLVIVL